MGASGEGSAGVADEQARPKTSVGVWILVGVVVLPVVLFLLIMAAGFVSGFLGG
jgi:hypothetical protein